ncbi:asparagine synthase (glutamine-hydrolyzing) [Actinomadura darangshiensis]|uniref:asparagine synthase (glutamine-hydrolyzing) n=1 Tax=Actinomadura darangshiensis TaxID=705336 RepID=A0A4R5BHY3_9ACTN|nr:asparagine synthase (glutamine-hydrolyzing) [Actinomadura darangshiensis]TDD84520.1 asparagine synthase (glutamine-hydrolyzing) [Actinomadura darangshiensis]
MCGITGWVDWTRDLRRQRPVIADMTRTQTPRGPDDEGIWLSRHAGLGHRRLAVIDIEGGRQPMPRTGHHGEPVVITFSGEIYNFHELREQLRSAGWSFATRSDTEVLLTAYLEWGPDLVTRLNGMYAFAIWDEHRQQLLLARDRLGIKPLYYAELGDGVIFGSEPKALLAHPGMKAEVDLEGLAELMVVPRARTPGHAVYRGMRELKPGCILVATASGSRETRYWRVEALPHTEDFRATTAAVRNLLTDIVKRQVVADVPVGTLLSGGIDSSAITALAAREFGGELTSYAVSVPAPARPGSDIWRPSPDEPYAELVAERLGIAHSVIQVGTDRLVGDLDRGLRARDLPGWGDLDTSMYHLFHEVRGKCTVALSGESADEMFGGYTWQVDERYIGHSSFPWMYSRPQPESLLREEVRRAIQPEAYEADRYREALGEVPHLAGEGPARRREREVFYLGLTRWLGALLDRKDRMSMAVGLEVRVPFADHRLAEYLFNVPADMKADGGTEKALLRRACADLLPDEIVKRPKSAYPASRDPEYLGMLKDLVIETADDPNAPLFDLMDRAKVRRAVTTELDALPGPITARTPAIGLTYLLELNRWLSRVRVVT